MRFVAGAAADQTIDVAGTWRQDGNGAMHVKATHVFLETLQGALEQPARYGGVVDLDATIRGTRDAPIVTGQIKISNGRVRGFSCRALRVGWCASPSCSAATSVRAGCWSA